MTEQVSDVEGWFDEADTDESGTQLCRDSVNVWLVDINRTRDLIYKNNTTATYI